MLHKAFMTANEIYQIYVPAEVRDLATNFEASKIIAGDVVRVMKELVNILGQQTSKQFVFVIPRQLTVFMVTQSSDCLRVLVRRIYAETFNA